MTSHKEGYCLTLFCHTPMPYRPIGLPPPHSLHDVILECSLSLDSISSRTQPVHQPSPCPWLNPLPVPSPSSTPNPCHQNTSTRPDPSTNTNSDSSKELAASKLRARSRLNVQAATAAFHHEIEKGIGIETQDPSQS